MDKENGMVVCVCMCVCTMEYYSAIKKDGSLPFAATWADLEGIMLNKTSQRKTKSVWYHLYVGFKNI